MWCNVVVQNIYNVGGQASRACRQLNLSAGVEPVDTPKSSLATQPPVTQLSPPPQLAHAGELKDGGRRVFHQSGVRAGSDTSGTECNDAGTCQP